MVDANQIVAADTGGGQLTAGAEGSAGRTEQFLTFTIGTEEYGVDILEVREIKGWSYATRLPNAPPYVRGVINLRGIMVPVFDLRARFRQGQTEVTRLHVVVIVAIGHRTIGLLVDTVSDILTVEAETIQPVPELERTIDTAYLSGLVAKEGRMVALLTLDRLFDFVNTTPAGRLTAQTP